MQIRMCVRQFLLLVFAVVFSSHCNHIAYAQSFWSIYDEEEAAKKKETVVPPPVKTVEEKKPAVPGNAESSAPKTAEPAAPAAPSTSSDWFFGLPAESASSDATADSGADQNDQNAESENSNQKVKIVVYVPPTPDFQIVPLLGANILQDPYIAAVYTGCDFYLPKMLEPFYFGGGIRVTFGFPKSDFPYSYEVEGGSLSSPILVSGNTSAIFGITFSPFANNLKLLISSRLGFELARLISFESKAASNVHPAVFANVSVGILFHNFEFTLSSEYDGVGKFSNGICFAYRIPVRLKNGGE